MTSPATATTELLLKFQQMHPRSIDLSLDRVLRLLGALGNPHQAMGPVIHVAGTNGKGSVVAFLRATLESAGLRVHVFTSPHLRDFNERIVLGAEGGGRPIGERALLDVLTRAETANAGQPITFFEITSAAAFLAFAETPADVVLLETGLGGRLDATNVVARPLLTVITPVSIDHTTFLGDTLEAIAGEKAGILKPGTPCVVSRQPDEALDVIKRRAAKIGSPLIIGGEQWDAYEQHGRLVFQDGRELVDLPLPRLTGRHQIDNAGTAVAAARALDRFGLTDENLVAGLTTAVWPARLERLTYGPLHECVSQGSEIWLDGGHNAAAGEVLARAMADLEDRVPRPLHLILGMMSTKDAAGFLEHFQDIAAFVATVSIPGQPNAYTCEELCAMARYMGFAAESATDLRRSLELSRREARGPVRVLITGSFYLAGTVLEAQEHGLPA
jgi:dihydrofolate synthase/folylpolyglutamate synthase